MNDDVLIEWNCFGGREGGREGGRGVLIRKEKKQLLVVIR